MFYFNIFNIFNLCTLHTAVIRYTRKPGTGGLTLPGTLAMDEDRQECLSYWHSARTGRSTSKVAYHYGWLADSAT